MEWDQLRPTSQLSVPQQLIDCCPRRITRNKWVLGPIAWLYSAGDVSNRRLGTVASVNNFAQFAWGDGDSLIPKRVYSLLRPPKAAELIGGERVDS